MTEPWMTITTCPTCGEDKFELNKLPVATFNPKLPPHGCECEPEFKKLDERGEE